MLTEAREQDSALSFTLSALKEPDKHVTLLQVAPPSSSDIDLGPLSLSGLNVIQQVQRPPEGPRSEGHSPLVMLSKLSGTFQQLKVGQNKLSGTIFGNRDRWLGKL